MCCSLKSDREGKDKKRTERKGERVEVNRMDVRENEEKREEERGKMWLHMPWY